MNWFELLRFSFGNLVRRKLRTALTVLGVMIGTASIVVMMSLGIGLNYSYMQQIQSSSTLTMITVYDYSMWDSSAKSDTALTADTIESFAALEHVVCTSPQYSFSVLLKSGKYETQTQVNAVSHDLLERFGIPLRSGSLPLAGDPISFIVGKQVGYNFYDSNSNGGYMGGYYSEDGTVTPPNVDVASDPIYIIYDVNAYYNAQNGSGAAPKKYQMTVAAVAGSADDSQYGYSQFDYNIYCDYDAVSELFTKMFKKNAWPNQSTDKNGKPVTPMRFEQAYVVVDDIDNVTAVQKQLTDMGYQAQSEVDYLKSMQEQSRTIQYILAGIGSVSLIVAAIGITNTMLMSIFERTKEIGIFKVLGCSLRNIRTMFLMEAGLIGFGGGALGVALSYLLSTAVNMLIGGGQSISIIPAWLALVGMGFAVVVGMVAGISPASRAMKLSPLEAIRTL
ncbi:MAG: FtsX-like permease family protein [Oscillospiraceae bacterium]|nr:FtsX-like permease family protein [Oscillospiraceae bacterium]